jgi:hypothetical protein
VNLATQHAHKITKTLNTFKIQNLKCLLAGVQRYSNKFYKVTVHDGERGGRGKGREMTKEGRGGWGPRGKIRKPNV